MCSIIHLPRLSRKLMALLQFNLMGGSTVAGHTYDEIVSALRNQSRDPRANLYEFMEATAEACKLQTGAIISTFSAEEFVSDLTEEGFLESVSTNIRRQ